MQAGYLSLLYSTGNKPLEYWSKQKSRTGLIRRVVDEELHENVLEVQDAEEPNFQRTWIMCPPETHQILNIKLPFLVIILKSTNSTCYFQIQFTDKESIRHLVNFSNVEQKRSSASRNAPPRMHLLLEPGWNRLEIDLHQLSKIFNSQFESLSRIKICANCRIRRIYCADRHYHEDEMPTSTYQGFLDNYMLKWGIKSIERSTQTKKTTGKPLAKDSLHPTNGFTKLFLKNLQAKSDKLIEEFFSRQSVKSIKDYLDFKRRAKIKPYVIPDNNRIYRKRGSESSLVDLTEFKRNFQRDNHFYGKLIFDDKNSKDKILEIRKDKKDPTYPPYRLQKYEFPKATEKKIIYTAKSDKSPVKYTSVNKLR